MDATVIASIVSGVAVVGGAVIAFMGQKKGTLATAEHNFREAILKDNEKLRNRLDEVEAENGELEAEVSNLRRRISKLETVIIKAGLVIEDEDG